MDAAVRVLVVGDGESVAPGLSSHMDGRLDLSVVDSAADVEVAIRLCKTTPIDVVLVDVDRPDREGVDAIRRLRSECPEAKVIALSANEATELIVEALTAGASGYAQKSNGIERLAEVIRYAVGGEVVMPDADLVHVLNQLHQTRNRSHVQERALERLTAREMDILRELAAGRSTGETAEVLGISPLTVQSHVKHILAKLGVHSKVEAVTLAWREGLAPIPHGAVGATRARLPGG